MVIEALDTGCGIAPEVLDKVFEPFFTTKPLGQGTGLGLSQVYGMCQRAGGTVTIDSAVGRGTAIRLVLPAAAATMAEQEPARRPLERELGCAILVVEDNTEVASALIPLLEALGCTASRVDSAGAALEWLAAHEKLPSLVLADILMPGDMDGIALATLLRSRWPELPVLLMTGYAERIDAAAKMGFEVLPKPCSPELLGSAIARVVKEAGLAVADAGRARGPSAVTTTRTS